MRGELLVVVDHPLEHALAAERIDAARRRLFKLFVFDRGCLGRGLYAERCEAQALRRVAQTPESAEKLGRLRQAFFKALGR